MIIVPHVGLATNARILKVRFSTFHVTPVTFYDLFRLSDHRNDKVLHQSLWVQRSKLA